MATARGVVVTGASGKLGQFVVEHLMDSGYQVVSTDRVAPSPGSPGSFTPADLTDLGPAEHWVPVAFRPSSAQYPALSG